MNMGYTKDYSETSEHQLHHCKFCKVKEGEIHKNDCGIITKRGKPHLFRVSFCNRCGTREGKDFMVSDEEWEKTIKYYYQTTDILCKECYEYVKMVKESYRIDTGIDLSKDNSHSKYIQRSICQKILEKYDNNDFVSSEDQKILIDIFKKHHHWEIKKGQGVKNIKVITNHWGKKVFEIHRIDGTRTDISFIKAIIGKPTPIKQKISNACRYAIRPIIAQEREKIVWGETKCAVTGELLVPHKTDIDHYDLTFDKLVTQWLKTKEKDKVIASLNEDSIDNVVDNFFIDKVLEKDFIDYHNKHTHLRPVTSNINKSLLKINQ